MKAKREAIPSLQLVADLKQTLGTWEKVAKKLNVNTRTIRRWRDGTRNPDRGKSKAVIKRVAKNQKLPLTKQIAINPDNLDANSFKRFDKDNRDFLIVVEYRVTITNEGTFTFYESFVTFGGSASDVMEQAQDKAKAIESQQKRKYKTAKVEILGIYAKPRT